MNYYQDIKETLIKNEIYKKVKDYSKNRNDLETYYKVGKLLVEAQGGEKKANYGDRLIKEYSIKLTNELGRGYTTTSLKRMSQFFLIFQKGAPVAHQLTWSHYCEILPIKEESKRNYYINISIKENLSKRELRNRIKNNEYERITEYILKQLILEDIDSFLKELGDGFSYIGKEHKIKIGDNYHYIDFLLFNYKFNCFIVIELKITNFKAEYIGQVKKYMNYVDKNIKTINQEKTVGVIICKREDKFIL